ncbi:MAG: poly-gamma-glutamate biosynthesis protein PgsC [Xanthomonadales bacterium]|nr:poly-gamma-glutamate biosynthesis protein PgsC [Xanthomonadales bacterium]
MMSLNLLAVAIGVGLGFTLLLTEAFGLAAGGLVVPGYVALKLLQPWTVLLTLLAAFGAFAIVRTMSGFVVIYGRRKTALMILSGYLLGSGLDLALGGVLTFPTADTNPALEAEPRYIELSVIGYIIPGLIAIWFDRQGVLRTVCGLVLTAVLVRLTLIAAIPETITAYEVRQALYQPEWAVLMEEGSGED